TPMETLPFPCRPPPAPWPKAELAEPLTPPPATVPTAVLLLPVTLTPAAWPIAMLNTLGTLSAEAEVFEVPPALAPITTPPLDAVAFVPQTTLFAPPGIAPSPLAVEAGTAAPVALPTHTNCADAGAGVTAAIATARTAKRIDSLI